MKTIDQVIKALVEIGNQYPKTQTSWERLFSPRTHQAIAQELINLESVKMENVLDQDKIIKLISVIRSIYQRIEKPGRLLKEIDACLHDGMNFTFYADKCVEIQKKINNCNNNVMESEGYDLQLAFNIENYREAINAISPNTLLPFNGMRGMSVESPRSSSIFSIEQSTYISNKIPFNKFEL